MANQIAQTQPLSHSLSVDDNWRVLLIEDNVSYAGYILALFDQSDKLNGEVTVANTLAKGIDYLKSDPDFSAVLLDLNLPDSRGLETLSGLLGEVPNANVIVLTGSDNPGQGEQAVSVGAQDFLIKRSEIEEQLLRAIRFSIQRKYFLQRLEEAQSLARIGNWEIQPAKNYFYASPIVYDFLQIDRKTHSYDSYEKLVEGDDCPLSYLLRHQQQRPEDEFYRESMEWELAEGEKIYGELNSRRSQSADGTVTYAGTLQDVTLQHRAEELQHARDLAEETARVREQVLANVSHELRTPMNAILGMSNILADTDLSVEQRECTNYIHEASQVLLGIINDILLSSSLQHSDVEMEQEVFDLPLTVRRIVEVIKPKAEAKKLELNYSLPENWSGKVIGDKQRLSQVLFNIIGNAVKFTQKGKVELYVKASAEVDNVRIELTDTGPGIPAAQQEQVFQPFVRIKQGDRNVEGTGLGLNIARQLVERMGGTIHLCSEVGQGSTFTIELPLPTVIASEVKLGSSAISETQKSILRLRRLLVVEDHPMNQVVIRRTLEREMPDLDIHIAESGERALELVVEYAYDLILMDIQLPRIDGYETTTAIRQLGGGTYQHIPIIAMTAQAEVANGEYYQEVGMVDYILKPFDPQDLFSKIAQYMHK